MAPSRDPSPPSIRYCPLVLVGLALAGGIVCDRAVDMPLPSWCVLATITLIAWLACWAWWSPCLASLTLLASVAAVGGAWHGACWRLYRGDEISRMVQEDAAPLCLEAFALTSPRWMPAPPPTPLRTIPLGERSEMLVWVTAVRDGERFRPASGRAMLTVGGFLDHVRAGDKLRVVAHGSRPAGPLNPGEFDFAHYLRSERIGCRLFAEFPASVERLAAGRPWSPRRWLAELRGGGSRILHRFIDPRRATLAAAVLLGAREQLDAERNEDYLVTGTIHVLSISGLHVGILAAGLFFVLRLGLVPRRLTLVATMILTIGYALLTDAEPPVVRASVLVVAACVGLWTGRSAFGFNSLAGAAIVVLALNPAALFLAGPQLSFLAVATMIAFAHYIIPQPISDPLDRLIAASRPWAVRAARHIGGVVWRVWLTGALVWLVSTPLIWKQYYLVSPSALVLNALLWLPVSAAMYCGLGTLIGGAWLPIVPRLLGLMCDRSLDVLERTIVAGRRWPGSHVWLASPPGWWIGVFYFALAVGVMFPRWRLPRRWLMAAGAVWLAGALVMSGRQVFRVSPASERPLVCHFVSVGHGVSVLVELPDGRTLLYDAGRLGSPQTPVRSISAVLWSRGITHLDAVVVSHADADHFNAIPGLLERFSIGAIYVSPVMFERRQPAVEELRRAIERSGVPVRDIHGGQRLAAGPDTALEVLHPPRKGVYGSDNANSIVLSIEHAGRRVLLTGDLESPGLEDVMAEAPLDCDVVLAPHHGSPRSSPGHFAAWCQPEYVVISGSKSLGDAAAREGVKHSFRLCGAEVFHTAEDGCVRVEISSALLAVQSFRPHVRALPAELASTRFLQAAH